MKKMISLEINEVPYRLIEHFRSQKKFKNIEWFFANSWQFETVTVDEGELSPWVTWPTVHRGMPATEHNVYNLGQDVATFKGTPIWEEVRDKGYNIGIFGPMQSWPPKDPGPKGFFIPDTFAHDEQCIPHDISKLQKFNLSMVKKNPRVVSSKLASFGETVDFLKTAIKYGLSFRTVALIGVQLLSELVVPKRRARRPIFQTVIFWDIFKYLYRTNRLDLKYSCFFTNHIAGIMHRYWRDIFPEDFGDKKQGPHNETMVFALTILDEILHDVRKFLVDDPELVVLFVSSMGQGPIKRDSHSGYELSLNSVSNLLVSVCKYEIDFKSLMAMVPQVAIEINDDKVIIELMALLQDIHFQSGEKVFDIKRIGNSLSITVITPSISDINANRIICGADVYLFEQVGIVVNKVDPGTAYHIPEGVFSLISSDLIKNKQPVQTFRQQFDADKCKKLMLNILEDDKSVDKTLEEFFLPSLVQAGKGIITK